MELTLWLIFAASAMAVALLTIRATGKQAQAQIEWQGDGEIETGWTDEAMTKHLRLYSARRLLRHRKGNR